MLSIKFMTCLYTYHSAWFRRGMTVLSKPYTSNIRYSWSKYIETNIYEIWYYLVTNRFRTWRSLSGSMVSIEIRAQIHVYWSGIWFKQLLAWFSAIKLPPVVGFEPQPSGPHRGSLNNCATGATIVELYAISPGTYTSLLYRCTVVWITGSESFELDWNIDKLVVVMILKFPPVVGFELQRVRAKNSPKTGQIRLKPAFFPQNPSKKCFLSIYENGFPHFSLIRMFLGAKTTINSHGDVEYGPKTHKNGQNY